MPLRIVLLLVAALLQGCGPASSAGMDGPTLAELTRQLGGDGCAYDCLPGASVCAPRAGGFLARFVTSDRECIRAAANCLATLGPAAAPAVPALIEAARHGPNNFDTGDGIIAVRDAILLALGSSGDARAIPALLEALAHPKPLDAGPGAAGYTSMRPYGEEPALRAFEKLGPVAAPALAAIIPHLARPESTPSDIRISAAAAAALGAIGAPAAIPALIEALSREPIMADAARALGRFGPAARAALAPLSAAIRAQPDRSGNTVIRRAIREIAGPEAAAALPRNYELTLDEIWRLTRTAAGRKGVRLGAIYINTPKEEFSATFPEGRRIVISLHRDTYVTKRLPAGTLALSREGRELSRQTYQGLPQLERLLAAALP